jgi:hypothetical protein
MLSFRMHLLKTGTIFLAVTAALFAMSLLLIASDSFAFETSLKTEAANPSEVKGIFTLILYGGNYYDDLETMAILDREGDQYTLDLYKPDFDYRVIKDLPAKEALAKAEKFIRFNPSFWHSQLSKILDNKGDVIAYELRPLYYPITYGSSDVLDVHYWTKEGGRVKITVRLITSVERLRFPGGGISAGSGGGN